MRCFRSAIQGLHDNVRAAVLLADVMNGADVRMIQSGGRPGLALETLQGVGVAGEFVRQEFESDETVQAGVFSLVDHAHPAAAEFSDNAVMGDAGADGEIAAFVVAPRLRALALLRARLVAYVPRGHFHRRTIQETSYLLIGGQQRPDFALQLWIARACLPQKLSAHGSGTLQGGVQQVIDLFPAIGIHAWLTASLRIQPWRELGLVAGVPRYR
jgi:hypothetical protein